MTRRRGLLTLARRTLVLTAVTFAATAGSAWGATLSFTGTFSSDWNTAANWTNTANASLHAVPTAVDTARIQLGKAPVLATGADGAARSVALDPGASLSVSGHTLAITGGATSVFQGAVRLATATLRLGGASTWSAGDWSLDGSTVSNTGTLSITGDVTAAGVNAPSRVANTGTITRNDATPTTGTAAFTAPLDNGGTFSVAAGSADLRGGGGPDTGSFSIAAGALLAVAGTHVLDAESVVTGAGTLRVDGGTFTVPAAAFGFSPGTVLLSGGFLDLGKDSTVGRLTSDGEGGGRRGGGILSAGGPTLLNNVTLDSSLTILTGPAVTVRQVSFVAAVLNLSATTQTLWDSGTWDLFASRVENDGSLRVTGDGSVLNRSSSVVSNAGTLTRDDAAAGGVASFRAALLNDGAVDVVSGELQLAGSAPDTSGGTFTIAAAAVLSVTGAPALSARGGVTGAGTLRLDAGSIAVPPGARVGVFDPGNVVFSGGFLNLGRDATVGRLTSDGEGGGRTGGVGTLTAGGPTVLDNVSLFAGTTNLTGPDVTLRNLTATGSSLNLAAAAHAVWDAGDWQLSDAIVTNAGELRVTGDGTAADAADPPLVQNTGTLIRDDADPSTGGQPFTARLRNSGVLHVVRGALDLGTLGEQSGGRTIVDSGARLGGPSARYTVAGGRVEGTGAIAGALDNSGGTVAPGASPGVLSVDGTYTQGPGATLETEVTGPDPGTGYDRVAVSGSATLAGTLDIITPTAFVPPLRSIFDVVSSASLAGTFETVLGADLADRQYAVDYSADPGRVRLRVPVDQTEGVVAVSGGLLEFTALPGDVVNSVTLSGPTAGFYSVRDTRAPVTAGDGCAQIDANQVQCAAAGVRQGALALGAGNDVGTVSGSLPTTLTGDEGADRLVGGTGADTLAGDGGPDVLQGGGGIDTATYAGRSEPVSVTVGGVADDGGSSDGPVGARDNVATDVENLIGGSGADSLTGSTAANRLTGGAGDDTLVGGAGADSLNGADGADALRGDADNDTLDGGAGPDALVGGLGADTATYAGGSESVSVTVDGLADDGGASDGPAGARDNVATDVENLVGGSGADSLTGSAAANTLNGGLGSDTLRGGDGNDSLLGGDGPDSLFGGAQNDTLDGGAGPDALQGEVGGDTATYAGRSEPLSVTVDGVADDGGSSDGPAGARDDVDIDVENVIGGSGADALTGSAAANRLTGGAGNDALVGADGNDSLLGGDGADSLVGGLLNDTLDGGTGADALQGGLGADTATYAGRTEVLSVTIDGVADDGGGSDGPAGTRDNVDIDVENLVGGSGADSLTGSAAANNLNGGLGADTLVGGAQNDTLDGGAGPDSLQGGAGADTATYSARLEPVSVTVDGVADDGGSTDGLAGARDNVGLDVENLVGGSGADSLTGSTAANRLTGGVGDDTLVGGAGADSLSGGAGADALRGDADNDILDGGVDRDALFGGLGVDTATYTGRLEALSVTIDGVADDGGASDGPAGARDNVDIDVENLVGGSGADSLTGSAAANQLTGGLGADVLRGLEGNDVLTAKDGVADTELDCAGGTGDTVTVDATDPPSTGCESVKP